MSTPPADLEVLAAGRDVLVIRLADVVAKVHAKGTSLRELEARLAILERPAVAALFAPLRRGPRLVEGRLTTHWTAGRPVDATDPDAVPWAAAAVLLARLHRVPLDCREAWPTNGGPRRLAQRVGRLDHMNGESARQVRHAYDSLPGCLRQGALPADATLVHGDFHLGQLVAIDDPADPWRLVDADDLGLGDPAWDLARPAAWVAAGILDPEVFRRFIEAYAGAGGPAVKLARPWARLDLPARALTIQSAAVAVAASEREGRALTDVEEAFLEACPRIAGARHDRRLGLPPC